MCVCVCVYDLALNNPRRLICHRIPTNLNDPILCQTSEQCNIKINKLTQAYGEQVLLPTLVLSGSRQVIGKNLKYSAWYLLYMLKQNNKDSVLGYFLKKHYESLLLKNLMSIILHLNSSYFHPLVFLVFQRNCSSPSEKWYLSIKSN